MTKARIKPGNWGFNEDYTSAQLNASDAYWPDVVDGAGGGTWSPSTLISIGGSGLRVTTSFSVNGAGSINFYSGSVTVDSTGAVAFAGPTVDFGASTLVTFNDGIDVVAGNIDVDAGSVGITAGDLILAAGNATLTAGNLFLTAGNIDVGGNAAVAGILGVLGASSLNTVTAVSYSTSGSGVVATGSTLATAVGTTTTFNGPVTLANTMTASNASIVFSGSGRSIPRAPVTLPNTDATILLATSNTYFVASGNTADHNYTLTTTGAQDNEIVRVRCAVAGHDADIVDDGAVLLLSMRNATGRSNYAEFIKVAGVWQVLDQHIVP